MAGVNKVILIGNLGKDPEVRVFEGGTKKAMFSLATAESFKDKNGNRQEKTEWHNVIFWGNLCDVIEKFLKKGDSVYVEGKITQRSYDDKDGVKRYITEIVGASLTMLGGKKNSGDSSTGSGEGIDSETSPMSTGNSDDLPF